MRNSKFIRGFTIRVVSVIGCFLLGSCVDSNTPLTEKEEQVPLKLCVSLTDNGYTSDSEIIPMSTRAEELKPYVVTQIKIHTLFILKKVDDGWCVTDIRSDIIQIPDGQILREGETLELTEAGKNLVLTPGKYQFLLLVNAFISFDISVGDVIAENSVVCATLGSNPATDFYIAKEQLDVVKTGSLNQESGNKVELILQRNSALIRLILEGTGWSTFSSPSVKCQLRGDACIGIDIFGNPMRGELAGMGAQVDFSSKNYLVNGENLFFSSISQVNYNLSLFAVEKEAKSINLVISRIGGSHPNDYSFVGEHEVPSIPIRKNYITTILIRKDIDGNKIRLKTELNPIIADYWSKDYPPLEYIELNNN